MNEKELESKIIELVKMSYGVKNDELTIKTRFKEDLNAASVKMVALVSEIENELDVSIMLADASECTTIGDLIHLVAEEM